MALKSPKDKFKAKNKTSESESDNTVTQDTYKIRKKTIKKKSFKQKSNPASSTIPSKVYQTHQGGPTGVPLLPIIPAMIPVTMATYYPQYSSQSITYPVTLNNWNSVSSTQIQPLIYNLSVHPIPITIAPQVIPPICPYALMSQQIAQPVVIEEVPPTNYLYDISTVSPEQTVPELYQIQDVENDAANLTLYEMVEYNSSVDPLEMYLSLPRELFPTARMLALDPNPIIDEFCKIVNIHSHASWILDLEFGVPRVPITRQIATYDVKFNSVQCKNNPYAIHPGFESCSQEFKDVFLFYYDCVISSWYKGYILMNCDGSVENFQAWLLLPMQVFGMCWP